MFKLSKYLLGFPPLKILLNYTKRIVIPGFDGLPLYDVGSFFIRGIQKGSLTTRASSLSFNFFIALFPSIIFLFTLIPYVPIAGFQGTLLGLIRDFLPKNAYIATKTTIEDIVKHQRGGLLSFGFLLALYFSTNGVNAMMDSFNKTYHYVETRSPFKQRLVSIMVTVILSLLLLLAITLIIFSESALIYVVKIGLLRNQVTYYMLSGGKWVIIISLLFLNFSFLYYFAPARKKRFRFISAGSTLATFLSLATSLGFAYFVNNFGKYNKVYGSIGTLMVILLWIYFNSVILLVGFELNASIDNAKRDGRQTSS